ncbi:MAG: class I SAM-dependent methyltransferase [Alphaproteobacteria bacterium]|nr:class I SAM-dependent methyltransferase [Alphaproteobacteria bacterium]
MIERLPLIPRIRGLIARRVERPGAYSALQRAVGSDRVWTVFLDTLLRPTPGLRILDVGCGPADVLGYLPEVDYLGIDPNPAYIEGARKRFASRGRFEAWDIAALAAQRPAPFDVILLLGVLHHLTDAQAAHILGHAAALVAPGGRLLTLDGCRTPHIPALTRFLYWADRGDFTRDQAGYEALVRPFFPRISATLRDDLLRLPYTYLALDARP